VKLLELVVEEVQVYEQVKVHLMVQV